MDDGQAKHGAPMAHSTSEQGRGLGYPKASRVDLPGLALKALAVAGVLAAVQAVTAAHAQSPGRDDPRNFTVVGASLDMPDADIVAKLSSELGIEPEHYAFEFHRVAHFNSLDGCWWKRIDGPQPACVGMSVLAFNLDGQFWLGLKAEPELTSSSIRLHQALYRKGARNPALLPQEAPR